MKFTFLIKWVLGCASGLCSKTRYGMLVYSEQQQQNEEEEDKEKGEKEEGKEGGPGPVAAWWPREAPATLRWPE